jgi:hypothetical protein
MNKIKELQEEYKILNKGIDVEVNFNINFSKTVELYYGAYSNNPKKDPLYLQEEVIDSENYSDYLEKQSIQYHEQMRNHRKEFQARIDNFEAKCKEVAKELGKDFETFLKEDIQPD